MNTYEYVKLKQKYWAELNQIELQGSKIERGEKVFTKKPEDNYFQKLSKDSEQEIKQGDGKELGSSNEPGKIQALHSSSALGINIFEYWKVNKKFSTIAKALDIPTRDIESIVYEKKYEIFKEAKKHPNIDVSFNYNNGFVVAIECKFTEPFQTRKHDYGLKGKYIKDFNRWNEIPNIKKIADKISPEDNKFEFLHCAQLIKHVLGLLTQKKDKNKFKLMYLYYPAFFENNKKYEDEIGAFADAMLKDNIKFRSLSWQEVIRKLQNNREPEDQNYFDYIFKRYC